MIVIAGASVAGVAAATSLRRQGYDKPIVLLGDEGVLPYDRPPLSKAVLASSDEPQPVALASAEQLREFSIQLRPASPAVKLDRHSARVHVADGDPLAFEHLVIATGSAPRRLPMFDGIRGVHYLRTWSDAVNLRSDLPGCSRAVIIGGGFVGAEVAASLIARGLEVVLIEAAPRMMARALGPEASLAIEQLHRHHGVRVLCGTSVRRPLNGKTRVTGVELDDGAVIKADLVVIGIGTAPATEWLNGSGLLVADGVRCGPDLRARGRDNVWAVGDVARWASANSGIETRLEHWTGAREQAAHVALSISSGSRAACHAVPYVWSDQFDEHIQCVGATAGPGIHTTERTDLKPAGRKTRVFEHHRDGSLVGATGINAQFQVLQVRRALLMAERDAPVMPPPRRPPDRRTNSP